MPGPGELPNQLHTYVDELRGTDDVWRLRVLLHDFGLVWLSTAATDRAALVERTPEPTGDARWDAFLAALVEHLCFHAELEPPAWVHSPERYLPYLWIPVAELSTLRTEAIVHAPAAFEAHGIFIADRDLEVV